MLVIWAEEIGKCSGDKNLIGMIHQNSELIRKKPLRKMMSNGRVRLSHARQSRHHPRSSILIYPTFGFDILKSVFSDWPDEFHLMRIWSDDLDSLFDQTPYLTKKNIRKRHSVHYLILTQYDSLPLPQPPNRLKPIYPNFINLSTKPIISHISLGLLAFKLFNHHPSSFVCFFSYILLSLTLYDLDPTMFQLTSSSRLKLQFLTKFNIIKMGQS